MTIFQPVIEHEFNDKHIPYKIKGKFIKKLYFILEIEETDNFIKWSNNGNYFTILDGKGLEKYIFPYFFKHKSMESFIRSLNMYGFKTFDKDKKKRKKGINLNFHYKKFKRGNIDNLNKITLRNASLERKNNNGRKDDCIDDEDDDTYNTSLNVNYKYLYRKLSQSELMGILNLTLEYNYDINNHSVQPVVLNKQNFFMNTIPINNINNNYNNRNHLNIINNGVFTNDNYAYQNTINITQNYNGFNNNHHLMMINNNFSNNQQHYQNQYSNSNNLHQPHFNNVFKNISCIYPFTF